MDNRLHRRPTSEVMVGNTGIGGKNPVRVQSMTSTPTSDTENTVDQIMRIASAGAEIVRMTVRNMREAENLANIKSGLQKMDCFIPLVADVHFNPPIAEAAAKIVEKVRINPGNYGISPKKVYSELSDKDYNKELLRAKTAFSRLIKICREHKTALRIGVNHGSLSPRIIYRYGNTPEGMARSAMEFLRFCEEEDFHNVVVSLKSSNTLVMVQANLMMVEQMDRQGMDYPLHLGVTEAGEGEDGRIRSVTGIGTLLTEGIGDTIRVSLTEDPEKEVPVARKLLEHIERQRAGSTAGDIAADNGISGQPRLMTRKSRPVLNIGGDNMPVVISSSEVPGPDYLFSAETSRLGGYPLVTGSNYLQGSFEETGLIFLEASLAGLSGELLEKASSDKKVVFVAHSMTDCPPLEMRQYILTLTKYGCSNPVIFKKGYNFSSSEDFQIAAAADFAPLFIERAGDGLWLEYLPRGVFHANAGSSAPDTLYGPDASGTVDPGPDVTGKSLSPELSQIAGSTAFSILQSCRVRTTKTEFISCPSCGRTMFNIQKATAEVKKRLSHLRGLKIAVMGCIVNGPGEMADADYGYVGSGRGRVSLYKKQVPVKRNVPEEDAVDELIGLIKEEGDWHGRE
ncbi:MAG: (E)-4-hydroxy-3-methylbut-2-enyl-diphosphate synthase [Bacteroidales bacterium]